MTGLFFGLTTVDLQFLVDAYPASNTKVKATKNGIYAGGPAANAAVAFQYAGGDARLYSVIGNHTLRDFILADLKKSGVEVYDLLPQKPTEPVFASIITSEKSGDRTILSYHPQMDSSEIKPSGYATNDVQIALFDGFYMAGAIAFARELKKNNIPLVLDGGSWKEGMEELLPLMDMVICSGDFFPPGTKSHKEVIRYIKNAGITKIAITRGAKPVLFNSQNAAGEVYVEKTNVIDTLGAGDFFHGAFCYHYLQSNDFLEALQRASEIASFSCTAFGTRSWMKTKEGNDEKK